MKRFHHILSVLLLLFLVPALGQRTTLDTAKGFLNKFRSGYNVHFYDLTVQVDFEGRAITGSNIIHFQCEENVDTIQIDLASNFSVDSIRTGRVLLEFWRKENAIYAVVPQTENKGRNLQIGIYYHGSPQVAKNAPWDGGFVWAKDSSGRAWVATACQGIGASSWWPCKDHLSDEPDSMNITIAFPKDSLGLYAVSNGNLEKIEENDKLINFHWHVNNPINTYNVSLNIGNFAHFDRRYYSKEIGALQLDFYVLKGHLKKARNHFLQLYEMFDCFEELYGPYPFPEDGYGLVETPYWGMEHQGAIAYGNNFKNNDFGFDFILLHESGHEYWGNSISCKDHGDLWVHEAFTTYTEMLFVEKRSGVDSAMIYLEKQKGLIKNSEPIQGPLDVNYNEYKTTDMYYKGSAMLHTLRNVVDNDSLWFSMLKGLAQDYKKKGISGLKLMNEISDHGGSNLIPIMEHYLNELEPPILQVKIKKSRRGKKVTYKWSNVSSEFKMPIKFMVGEQTKLVLGSNEEQTILIPSEEPVIIDDKNFYILVNKD